jgi:photosystem II stability/assembly factor-like uncharacterized protein
MTGNASIAATTLPDIVNALAASPRFEQDGVCFAAQNSGLYRSDDGGRSWRSAYDALALQAPLATTAVALSPEFERDRTIFAGAHGGLLRSLDGGTTWQITMLPLPPPMVTTLAVSPSFANDGIIFAGTMEDGVFRSGDRGSSWAAWNFGLLDLNVLSMAISPSFAIDETLFAGTVSGLFRSTNGGRAWREVELPVEFAAVLSVAIAAGDNGASILFVGTEDSGLFCSNDNARTWRRLGEDTLVGAINAVVPAQQFDSIPDLLVLLNDAPLVSRDAGISWSQRRPGGLAGPGIAAIAAPLGLEPAAPLLAGLIEGGVVCL